ncbi:hypothetical protein [Corynebacterium variabile]|uniref:hypothetical protein n=1 Tax=Corynebacterium variabile TaxID=1727 RepID=UPI003FCF7D03
MKNAIPTDTKVKDATKTFNDPATIPPDTTNNAKLSAPVSEIPRKLVRDSRKGMTSKNLPDDKAATPNRKPLSMNSGFPLSSE